MAAQECVDRRTIAVERHEGDVDLGQLLEPGKPDVEGRSGTEAAHRDGAGLCARCIEQIVERAVRRRGLDEKTSGASTIRQIGSKLSSGW